VKTWMKLCNKRLTAACNGALVTAVREPGGTRGANQHEREDSNVTLQQKVDSSMQWSLVIAERMMAHLAATTTNASVRT
jgi:hypothetical protein